MATTRKQRPVIRPKEPRSETFASFLDLIDLLFVKRFLDQEFALQHIRKAFNEARDILEVPHFASSKFFTLGKKIFVEDKPDSKHLFTLLTRGQLAFSEIVVNLGERIDFEEINGYELAARWYPLGREGKIVIDPQISYGRPTIVGRATRTANVYDLYLGEKGKAETVGYWFELPTDDVNAAVKFEQSLAEA